MIETAHTLLLSLNAAGCFAGAPAGALAGEARRWCHAFTAALPTLPLHLLPQLLAYFEPLHRIAHGTPAPRTLVDHWTNRYLDAWLRGQLPASSDPIILSTLRPRVLSSDPTLTPALIQKYNSLTRHAESAKTVAEDAEGRVARGGKTYNGGNLGEVTALTSERSKIDNPMSQPRRGKTWG